MIKIENLSFGFTDNKKLFTHFSCSLEKPALYFLQGKNGTGKTTFFSIVQGNQSGKFLTGTLFCNKKTYQLGSIEHQVFAQQAFTAVPQNFDEMLAPQFTFIQNLQFTSIGSRPTYRILREAIEIPSLLKKYHIPLNQPVETLSGGQRQILSIIMAVQKPTQLLLLDEPTAALDQQNAEMVMEFLQEFQQNNNLTILIICHDQELLRYSPVPPIKL